MNEDIQLCLEIVVVAVESLRHVGGDVGIAASEDHVDHVCS